MNSHWFDTVTSQDLGDELKCLLLDNRSVLEGMGAEAFKEVLFLITQGRQHDAELMVISNTKDLNTLSNAMDKLAQEQENSNKIQQARIELAHKVVRLIGSSVARILLTSLLSPL